VFSRACAWGRVLSLPSLYLSSLAGNSLGRAVTVTPKTAGVGRAAAVAAGGWGLRAWCWAAGSSVTLLADKRRWAVTVPWAQGWTFSCAARCHCEDPSVLLKNSWIASVQACWQQAWI
jgi:hypothetical protein